MTKSITVSQAMQIAVTHHQAGRLAEAERIYRQVLSHDPKHADAIFLLGVVADQLGDSAKAVPLLQQALALHSNRPEILASLGNALRSLGRLDEAVQACRRAVALKPDFVDAHNNLGNALADLGRFEEAETCYRRALALKPDLAEAYSNLANVQRGLGRPKEAEESSRRALELRPSFAEAHNNLGNALQALGRAGEAERHYRQALVLKPSYAEAHNNLGNALRALGRVAEAEQSFRSALALKPRYAEAHFNLGNVLQDLGRTQDAEQSYRHALTCKPDFVEARAMWLHQCRHLCAWSELEAQASRELDSPAQVESGRIHPFMLLFSSRGTSAQQLAGARAFASKEYRAQIAAPALGRAAAGARPARLRIGYLSADYHDHPTSHLLVDVIERHDRRRFQVYGYSYGPQDASAICRRIRAAFDVFRDVRHSSDHEAAARIADDHIDILVDLKGYTANNRAQILALRPARLQVSWLGYPGTLGHPRLADYLIGDPIVTPLQEASGFSEILALMPHCYQPNDRGRAIGARPTRTEAGLPPDGFVFCSFNQAYKITPAMFDLWCRLLAAVPGSVLWLLDPVAAARGNLLREAALRGVQGEKLIFAPRWPAERHLGRLQLADLALDTYPVTSHTTASDALWAGVPLVTQRGETFISRVAASVLRAAGLPELVTSDRDAYYRLALELATQPKRVKLLRSKLARNRAQCPLFDSFRFTRDLEHLYERVWQNCREGRKERVVVQSSGRKKAKRRLRA